MKSENFIILWMLNEKYKVAQKIVWLLFLTVVNNF